MFPRGHGRNQGTTRQMILQYTTADVKERARDGARVLPGYMGKAMGGFRLMRHVCRHVRITIIVIIGLARLLCVLACPFPPLRDWRGGRVYVRIGCRGRTRAGQDARTKIDEDEMKEVLGWLGVVHLLCRLRKLSALVPFGNRCCERQKEGFCPKPAPDGGRDDGWVHEHSTHCLSMHAIMPHLACDTGRTPYPMPCSGLLLIVTEHTWISEGDFVRC